MDIFQVSYANYKDQVMRKALQIFHAIAPADALTVYGCGNEYGLACTISGADKQDFEATLQDRSTAVQDGSEAQGLARNEASTERDGRTIVAVAPNPAGWKSYYAGAGDQLSPRIVGGGQRIRLSFTGPDTKSVEVQFSEPSELHDGQASYMPVANWGLDDLLDFSAILPASPCAANGTNTGNANKVALGGGLSMLVPAFGDGAWDIDLATVVPVPSSTYSGYFDVDHDTGAVAVSVKPGAAEMALFDLPFEVYFARKIPLGNSLGLFDVDAYKTQWVSERWKLKISVVKASAGAGDVAGWLLAYRKNPQ